MDSTDFWSAQDMRALPVYVLRRNLKTTAYPRHVFVCDQWQNGQPVTLTKGTLLTYSGINGGTTLMQPPCRGVVGTTRSMNVVRVTKKSNRVVVTGDWCEVPLAALGFSHYLIVDADRNIRMQYNGEV